MPCAGHHNFVTVTTFSPSIVPHLLDICRENPYAEKYLLTERMKAYDDKKSRSQ